MSEQEFKVQVLEALAQIRATMSERCTNHATSIQFLEKSSLRQGERIGKLEAESLERKGERKVVAAIFAAIGAFSGIAASFASKFIQNI